MSKYIAKFARLSQIIKEHGGPVPAFIKIYKNDELKTGRLVGEDKFGNKYFQNNMYFMGRSRWVEYSPAVNMDYDASQIPAEWHRWLHYIGDEPPTELPPTQRKWMSDHSENLSATSDEYVPYSTAKPKVQAWSPAKK
ncbi:probable NADH dehydrogenase [ubiquinone] 1 alpha subcomplex subunit 12 [Haliotis cracherodii]|uniref:probable NADH dehydrogenase [ubiquinone] 1 alpha subcomplex subunit 12 n=1 Tax=Haliotis cracherodii TaxID=6455 RepID=UPI0039ECF397